MTQPSIGRVVHYHPPAPLPRGPLAAIVTAVYEDGVALTVFAPDHLPGYLSGRVTYSEQPKPGHWSWPPRV